MAPGESRVIQSPRNRRVVAASRLKKRAFRERDRRFLIEGPQAVGEALAAGRVETLFTVPGGHDDLAARAANGGVPVHPITPEVMGHLTSTVTPQGVLAVAPFVDVTAEQLPEPLSLVAVLCQVRDPGNAGTVLRSADAAGASAVIVSAASVDLYNPKTVRASAGSLFHLPVVRDVPVPEAVAALRDRGLQVLAADVGGDVSLAEVDLGRPTALLFGNEAWGLPAEVTSLADATVRVPMRGRAESLNLAAAAAVLLFEAARAQGGEPSARATGAGAGPGHPDAGDGFAAVVSDAAHDLRSPLTSLRGLAQLLERRWDRLGEADRRELLEAIAHESERMGIAIRQLVDAARGAGGGLSVEQRSGTLDAAVTRAAELFGRDAEHPPVRVAGLAGSRLAVDEDRVTAALAGLLDVLGWPSGDPVIDLVVEDRAVRLSRGGVSEADPSVRAVLAGRGEKALRVAAARAVAEGHGGSLEVSATDGLAFRLRLG